MDVIKNPTREQYFGLMNRSKVNEIRGIIADDGTIFIADSYDNLHDRIAQQVGVQHYRTFLMELPYDPEDGYDVYLSNYCVYNEIRWLKRYRVQMPTVGIVPAQKEAA